MPKKTKKIQPILVVKHSGKEDHTYLPSGSLGNRGQPGVAGFYKEDLFSKGSRLLIKQDKPKTCLAESLVVDYLPEGEVNRAGINRAHIGIAHTQNTPSKKMVVSVQDKVAPKAGEEFIRFDTLVLGHERVPDTSTSEESRNSKRIKAYLATELSHKVKLQLAQAIYMSQVNGDESLHLGQFVGSAKKTTDAQGNEKYVISDIKRIDFGALGRHAMLRSGKENSPEHTSSQYRYYKMGQRGKDYVSYLLQDPIIKGEVLRLWSKTEPEEVAKQVGERFDEQVAALDDSDNPKLKANALSGFYKELGAAGRSAADEQSVKNNLVTSTENRCKDMKKVALAHQNQNDLIVIGAFEEYVNHEFEAHPKDAVLLKMKIYLEEISHLPIGERFQKVQEAQAKLLNQESAAKHSPDPAPSSVEHATKASSYKKAYSEARTPLLPPTEGDSEEEELGTRFSGG